MFVKLVQGNQETLHDCHTVRTKTFIDSGSKSILLSLSNGTETEIEVLPGMLVFIMNNEGKTIDRIRSKTDGQKPRR
jgi:hypothetical protein